MCTKAVTRHCPYCGNSILLTHKPACDLAESPDAHADFLEGLDLGVAELPTAVRVPAPSHTSAPVLDRMHMLAKARKAMAEAGAHVRATRGTIDPATRALYEALSAVLGLLETPKGGVL